MDCITPEVSVAIPAYNAATTITDCLESILESSDVAIEIVVCDDASTDNTRERIQSLNDSRIRLIQAPQNTGPGPARDAAIAACKGEWIALCDADDMWLPGRLLALLKATGGNHDIVAFDDIIDCHSTTSGLAPWRRIRGDNGFCASGEPVEVALEQWIDSQRLILKPLFSARLLRLSRAAHGNLAVAEDLYFLLRLLSRGGSFVYVPQAYYLYRITPGSALSNVKRYRLTREVLEECAGSYRSRPAVYAALLRKIERMRKLERYREFLDAVKQGRLMAASKIFLRRPSVIWQLILHNVTIMPYRIHRLLSGGIARGTK